MMTQEEWRAKAVELFGQDPMDWKFVWAAVLRPPTGILFKVRAARASRRAEACSG